MRYLLLLLGGLFIIGCGDSQPKNGMISVIESDHQQGNKDPEISNSINSNENISVPKYLGKKDLGIIDWGTETLVFKFDKKLQEASGTLRIRVQGHWKIIDWEIRHIDNEIIFFARPDSPWLKPKSFYRVDLEFQGLTGKTQKEEFIYFNTSIR